MGDCPDTLDTPIDVKRRSGQVGVLASPDPLEAFVRSGRRGQLEVVSIQVCPPQPGYPVAHDPADFHCYAGHFFVDDRRRTFSWIFERPRKWLRLRLGVRWAIKRGAFVRRGRRHFAWI